MLVGTKLDLDIERQVLYFEALDLSQKLKLAGVIETSAKTENTATKEDINDCFRIVALNIYQRLPYFSP